MILGIKTRARFRRFPDGYFHDPGVFGLKIPGKPVMDELGNIYVSGNGALPNNSGVTAFDSKGNRILNIAAGGGTNNVFAGKNNKLLFITGPADRVTSVQMNVKGVEKF